MWQAIKKAAITNAIGLRFDQARYAYGAFLGASASAAFFYQFYIAEHWPIVGPEFYGPFVYAIDLKFWTMTQFFGGFLGNISLAFLPGRIAAAGGLLGALVSLIIFAILGVLSLYAPIQNPMMAVVFCIGIPLMSLVSFACFLRLCHD